MGPDAGKIIQIRISKEPRISGFRGNQNDIPCQEIRNEGFKTKKMFMKRKEGEGGKEGRREGRKEGRKEGRNTEDMARHRTAVPIIKLYTTREKKPSGCRKRSL